MKTNEKSMEFDQNQEKIQFRSVIFFRQNIFFFYYDYKVFCKKIFHYSVFLESHVVPPMAPALAEPTYPGLTRL